MFKLEMRRVVAGLLIIGCCFGSGVAQAQVAVDNLDPESIHAGEFVVPINKSQVLKVDQPFTELLIGNPEIADVVATWEA